MDVSLSLPLSEHVSGEDQQQERSSYPSLSLSFQMEYIYSYLRPRFPILKFLKTFQTTGIFIK